MKEFGTKLADHPEIAAMAIAMYSERLPGELIKEWPGYRRLADEEAEWDF